MNRRLITNIIEGKHSSIDISEIPTKKTLCCNRKKKYCGDYIFRYEDDETLDYLEVAEEVRRKFNTCVIGRHLIDGHEVLYKNAMEVSADLGVDFR